MNAIVTTYFGPTDKKPSRLRVTLRGARAMWVNYPHELDSYYAHRYAAGKMAERENWRMTPLADETDRFLQPGLLPDGKSYAHCLVITTR